MKRFVLTVLILASVACIGHCLEGAFGNKKRSYVSEQVSERTDDSSHAVSDSGRQYAPVDIAAGIRMIGVLGDSTVADFQISETEVTLDQLYEVNGFAKRIDGYFPAVDLRLNEIVDFCNRLSELGGLSKCYSFDADGYCLCDFAASGYRLPTEEEWAYAFKGGRFSRGFAYSGSDSPDDVSWYEGNSDGALHKVKMLRPNELGLYDMSGNASEICWPSNGYNFVAHGGNFALSAGENLQQYSSIRLLSDSDWKSGKNGFRIARKL